ncbi:MAG: urease accessory protein UreD [Candidatus Sulfotelmatobacter sp.]
MRASLRLGFARDNATGQTTLAFSHQEPPLRVVRAFHPENGSAMAHLHNVSGGLFGGDDLTLHVDVGKGAEAQLTTTGATRVYRRGLGTAITRQHNDFTVSEDAILEYVPDAIIPFAGANYYQHTIVRLSRSAGLFWWEILAPGREARNEVFAFERVEMRTEIVAEGEMASIDRMKIEPHKNSIASPGRMGPYRYCATVFICKVSVGAEVWLDLEGRLRKIAADLPQLEGTLWGVSTLKAHGLMIRCLAKQGRDATAGLFCLWDEAKLALYGRHAVRPRKTY